MPVMNYLAGVMLGGVERNTRTSTARCVIVAGTRPPESQTEGPGSRTRGEEGGLPRDPGFASDRRAGNLFFLGGGGRKSREHAVVLLQ